MGFALLYPSYFVLPKLPGYSAILYFHPNELLIDFLLGIGNV
jgi:hypothetical protein